MTEHDAIRDHLEHVDRTTASKIYIETGWPSYAAIPLFIQRFGEEAVGIIRIVRNPVHVAISFVTHGFWNGRADAYATDGILQPWGPGIVQTEYRARWGYMSAYEKCLFWWSELHLYGDDLRERFGRNPFIDVRFEDLFDPSSPRLDEVVRFAGLPSRSMRDALPQRVDERQQRTRSRLDWWEIFDHPNVLAIAERYGYKVRWANAKALRKRYGMRVESDPGRLIRLGRRARALARSIR